MRSNTKNKEKIPAFDLKNVSEEAREYVENALDEIQKNPLSQKEIYNRTLHFLEQEASIIKHEDNLINNRMTWMLAFQGFLIAAVSLQIKKNNYNSELILLFCTLGITVVFVSYYTICRGLKSISRNFQDAEYIREYLSALFPDIKIYSIIGRRSPAAKWMQLSEETKKKEKSDKKISICEIALFYLQHFSAAWRSLPIIFTYFWIYLAFSNSGYFYAEIFHVVFSCFVTILKIVFPFFLMGWVMLYMEKK